MLVERETRMPLKRGQGWLLSEGSTGEDPQGGNRRFNMLRQGLAMWCLGANGLLSLAPTRSLPSDKGRLEMSILLLQID